ncbi:MAG TPA: hypothetical protein P5526_15530 [Anaerolineae bacterium]|nr:hypothetical protein [Anaerolineales bacterium]HRV93570.1 hypothetical protein [Anaerolineae bacterium]
MAAATKAKNGNGNIAAEAFVDMAAQASEGAKAAANNVVEAVNNYGANSVSYLNALQNLTQTNLDLYQNYAKVYADFVTGVYQQSMDQSLALREQFGQMFEAHYQKAEGLNAGEQQFLFEAVERFQAQAKANSERVAEFFTPAK